MLRKHFMMSGLEKPDYVITYYADQHVPFIGGEETANLTMWETGIESEPLAEFKVVSDTYTDGYGEWGIKTSNPTVYYSLIQDSNNNTYYADSGGTGSITGIIFPEGITEIGGQLLKNSSSLIEVKLPNSLLELNNWVFSGSNISHIHIPDSLELLEANCFAKNFALNEITVSPKNINFVVKNNCLMSKDESILVLGTNNSNIPNTTKIIGQDSFNGRNLQQIEIPLNITSIQDRAFANNKFTTVVIPNSVTTFGNNILSYGSVQNIVLTEGLESIGGLQSCTALTTITLPESLKRIEMNTFNGNTNMQGAITIPASMQYIGNNAFEGTNLSKIIFATKEDEITHVQIPSILKSQFGYIDTGDSLDELPSISNKCETLYIGKAIQKIASSHSPISIIWNNNQYNTKDFCARSTRLTNITFGEYAQEVPTYICNSCTNLNEINFSDTITTIKTGAFYKCQALTSVTIPKNVTTIEEYVFKECSNLKKLTWNAIHCQDGSFNFSNVNNVVFGNEVEYIPGNLFKLNYNITSIYIPSNVKTIGPSAFYLCKELTSVSGCKGITSIEAGAFYYTGIKSITLSNTLTTIGSYAFRSAKLTSITIPNSVLTIGGDAFNYDHTFEQPTLTRTNYTGDITSWCNITFGNDYSNPIFVSKNFYINDQEITGELIIPETVSNIKNYVFAGLSSMTSIILPISVVNIGKSVFKGCSNLSEINYAGTIEQWNTITKESDWKNNVPSTCVVHCTDGDISIADA